MLNFVNCTLYLRSTFSYWFAAYRQG